MKSEKNFKLFLMVCCKTLLFNEIKVIHKIYQSELKINLTSIFAVSCWCC